MKQIFILSAFLSFTGVFAQNSVEKVLNEIEANNTTLSYLSEKVNAEQIGHKTGIYPDNPEIGVNYLWGQPGGIGNRTDISISQSFDFPTAYSVRSRIADARIEQSQLQLEDYRIRLRLEARKLCYHLIFMNQNLEELKSRKAYAIQLASAYDRLMEVGETNLIEFNKASLNKLNAEQAFAKSLSKKEGLLIRLQALNGGKEISMDDTNYPLAKSFENFDSWITYAIEQQAHLQSLRQESEILEQEEKLTKAMRLPKINAGYMSEKTQDEKFQGLTLGLSVPLWENKNKQKLARAQSEASVKLADDAQLQFYHHLKNAYNTSERLGEVSDNLSTGLEKFNNAILLKKAFQAGELSLISYLMELRFYYDTVDTILEAQLSHREALAELEVYGK